MMAASTGSPALRWARALRGEALRGEGLRGEAFLRRALVSAPPFPAASSPSATPTGSGGRERGLECDALAVERVQRALQRHRDACEAGGVAHGVSRGLG